MNDLARTIIEVCGSGPEAVHVDPRPGDILHSQADTRAAAEAFGYTTGTTMQEGLRLTMTGVSDDKPLLHQFPHPGSPGASFRFDGD